MTYTSLLVPLDYGPESNRAAEIAGRLAARAGIPIELVTVTDPRLDPDEDRGELLRIAEQLRPQTCLVTVLRSDDVTGTLTHALEDRPDALPIIGTAARGPLAELFDPGVWERVLDATGRAALLVGPHVVDEEVAARPLLLAVTPGAHTGNLVDAASRWAETFDVEVSVIDLLDEGGLAEPRAQFLLRDVSSSLRHHGVPAMITVVRRDDPADALVSQPNQGIPAVTSERWITGERVHRASLAREVVRASTLPVLVIPGARRPSAPPIPA